MCAQTGPSRRERQRAALLADIHEAAYRQIGQSGFAAVSMTGIAQALGMSPAALYRYFASRDDLVRALIVESFEANAVLTEQALADTAGRPAEVRLRRLLAVTREWAVTHPTQYAIVNGTLRDAQHTDVDAMVEPERRPFLAICFLLTEIGVPDTLASATVPVLDDWTRRLPGGAVPGKYTAAVVLHALVVWSRLHGVITLEINGVLDRMGLDATRCFDAEVDQLLPAGGRPAP